MNRKQKEISQEYIETIKCSELLNEVPKREQQAALESLKIKIKEYKEEELIFLEGEEVEDIAILHSGTVRGEKFHMEGEIDLMHIYQRGEIFGVEAPVSRLKTSPLTYMANEDVCVIHIDFKSALKTEYAAEFALALLHILADDNIKKLYKIDTLSKRGLRDRIMTYLKIINQKSSDEVFCINMDREQFAQYLCVNRSALSYELNQMKREGLIDFRKDRFKLLEKN